MHYRISEWTYEGRNLRNLLSGSLCCMEFNFWRADDSLAPGQMTLYSSFVISAPCAVSLTFFSPYIYIFFYPCKQRGCMNDNVHYPSPDWNIESFGLIAMKLCAVIPGSKTMHLDDFDNFFLFRAPRHVVPYYGHDFHCVPSLNQNHNFPWKQDANSLSQTVGTQNQSFIMSELSEYHKHFYWWLVDQANAFKALRPLLCSNKRRNYHPQSFLPVTFPGKVMDSCIMRLISIEWCLFLWKTFVCRATYFPNTPSHRESGHRHRHTPTKHECTKHKESALCEKN